ncbi:DUF2382 domain-containing protein [Kocuria flava]|uniref:YsnF/AvaK domain-containing protein n=1 Tax=Kocuria flava TaxID=446860 RepID=UPI003F1CBE9D
MSTSEDRPYDQESAARETAGGEPADRASGPRAGADDTGVERHAPSSATELWDHNAYGREDGDVGGDPTTGATDTRDPRGGAPAYNIDAGDDDAARHGDAAGGTSGVRAPGESLSGPDATAGDRHESVGGRGERSVPGRGADEAFDQEAFDRESAGGAGRDAAVAGTGRAPAGREQEARGRDLTGHGADGQDADGRTPVERGPAAAGEDTAAVVRHEERLDVGTERVETGRARLRKYVAEEPVRAEQSLAVEDVEEVRTPITEEERQAFLDGRELPVGEDEVILYREVPVVRTVRVPYERVRLVVRSTERTEVVEETVRKERVEVDGPIDGVDGTERTGAEDPRRG